MPKDTFRKEAGDLYAGLDEVGMGCLAGPACVAVVAFPPDFPPIEGVKDSKLLSRKKREELAPAIVRAATFVGVGWAHPSFIDEKGLAAAWQHAARQALLGAPDFLLLFVDGLREVSSYMGVQRAEPKGESKWWQVAAASIVAKVSRDHDMTEMAEVYPAYGFEKHMGYGTKAHLRQIRLAGPSPYHRVTFLKKMRARDLAPVP